jgi:hypothetical protein
VGDDAWETLLPEELLRAAYRSDGGECAWKRDDAISVRFGPYQHALEVRGNLCIFEQ